MFWHSDFAGDMKRQRNLENVNRTHKNVGVKDFVEII